MQQGGPSWADVITIAIHSAFGVAFQKAMQKTGARVSVDSFDSTILQVHKNDLEHFLENLYLS